MVAGGGPGSVTLTATAGCYWVANSDSAWLTVNTGSSSGQGTATVQFTVAANGSTSSRVGILTINGLTYTVTQAGNCSYTISPLSKTFTNTVGGTNQTVTVTAAAGCTTTTLP